MAVKKSSRSKTKVTEQIENNLVEDSSSQSAFPIDFKRSYIILIGIVIIVLGLAFYFKGFFVAALVNGKPISRLSIVSELEKQSGKQTLQSLVTKTLIMQEAKKQNVTVDEKDVDTELAKAEANLAARGQKLDQVLAQQGLTLENVKEQIRTEKLIEKMLANDVAVSDTEINAYIEQNKDSFAGATDEAKIKDSVKQQLKQQKLSTKFQSWIAELQKKADIKYFVNY